MKKFKLKTVQRLMCYAAVNSGANKGVGIDDELIPKIEIIKALKNGSTSETEDNIEFKSCDEKEELVFENKHFNILLAAIKANKYRTVEAAIQAKGLIDMLENLSDMPTEVAKPV